MIKVTIFDFNEKKNKEIAEQLRDFHVIEKEGFGKVLTFHSINLFKTYDIKITIDGSEKIDMQELSNTFKVKVVKEIEREIREKQVKIDNLRNMAFYMVDGYYNIFNILSLK